MSYAAKVLRSGVRRVLVVQVLVVGVVAVAFWLFGKGTFSALSVFYGGGVAMLATLLLGCRIQSASDASAIGGGYASAALYWGVLERYVVVAAGVGVGIGVLHLDPFPLIVGFGVAQTGYLLRLPDRL